MERTEKASTFAQKLADEITKWLENGKLPHDFYGIVTIPIQHGRVQIVKVEEKRIPIRN